MKLMTEPDDRNPATQILRRIREGEEEAASKLLPLVYENLRALAGSYLRGQRHDHTLQPTALVHEAFLRLVDQTGIQWQDRAHFLAVSAKAMRMILADHARRKKAQKRGGDWKRVTLQGVSNQQEESVLDLITLDEILEELTRLDERHAKIVELRFFSGLNVEEVAHVMECSKSTVESDWRIIRAWMTKKLRAKED